ncbi:hypothetical protein [Chondromyces apiculatus]|uniref:Uncharacterized protein n=1 Tax=Chondromyces apiculatus DSM 436 TaxID=1192034 RepID=A0A017TEB6_9BACT|nr:hypothetical protein [Chondromyces apiculatus]EYF07165.1 Hypothetical protein CAP_0644 [Chondromyces apiculatus DSM 436]
MPTAIRGMGERTGVVVQTIHTRWTKQSRGQPQADARNATPEVLDLEAARPESAVSAGIAWHDVVCDEAWGFTPRGRYVVLPARSGQFHGVDVAWTGEGAAVAVFGRRCFVASEGETGVVIYNGTEDVIEDGWRATRYHKMVFRVGVGVTWAPGLFRGPVDHERRMMRDLA